MDLRIPAAKGSRTNLVEQWRVPHFYEVWSTYSLGILPTERSSVHTLCCCGKWLNGREQLAKRVVTNSGSADGTSYYVYDQWGNLLAELDGAGNTVREYIWLLETQIAPVMDARAQVDRPIAVVSGVSIASPALLMVHVDHV